MWKTLKLQLEEKFHVYKEIKKKKTLKHETKKKKKKKKKKK